MVFAILQGLGGVVNPFSSFLSGLVAAFSPCVAVLIPLLLYRFVGSETRSNAITGSKPKADSNSEATLNSTTGRNSKAGLSSGAGSNNGYSGIKGSFLFWRDLSLFVAGFLGSFFILSWFFMNLFSSTVQNGLRLGLGLLFISLALLSFLGHLNPFNFPMVKNPFLLGVIFSLVLGVNPCTIPFLGAIVGLKLSSGVDFFFVLNMFFFGLGLITPSLLFVFFGERVLFFSKSSLSSRVLHSINRVMDLLLLLVGFYLAFTIKGFGINDLWVAIILLLFTMIIFLRAFFILRGFSDLKKPSTLALFFAMLLILSATIYHCRASLTTIATGSAGLSSTGSCSASVFDCEVCTRCIFIFLSAFVIGFFGVFLADKMISFDSSLRR